MNKIIMLAFTVIMLLNFASCATDPYQEQRDDVAKCMEQMRLNSTTDLQSYEILCKRIYFDRKESENE